MRIIEVKSCVECPYRDYDRNWNAFSCDKTGLILADSNNIPRNCPLKEG